MNSQLKFPVIAHHRIIVNAAARDDAKTVELFNGFELIEPVAVGNTSSSGKYVSFGLSVRLKDREDMARLDEKIKLVPGLKMVL